MNLQSSHDCFNKYFQSIRDWNQESVQCFACKTEPRPTLQHTYRHRQIPPISAQILNQWQTMRWVKILPEKYSANKLLPSNKPATNSNQYVNQPHHPNVPPDPSFNNNRIQPAGLSHSTKTQRLFTNMNYARTGGPMPSSHLLTGITEADLDFDFHPDSNSNFPTTITAEDLDFDLHLESNHALSSAPANQPNQPSNKSQFVHSTQNTFPSGSTHVLDTFGSRTVPTSSNPLTSSYTTPNIYNNQKIDSHQLKPANSYSNYQQADVIDLTADCSQESEPQISGHRLNPGGAPQMNNDNVRSVLGSALPSYLLESTHSQPCFKSNTNQYHRSDSGMKPVNPPPRTTVWSSTFPWTHRLRSINLSVFGNKTFRPLQEEIINAALSHKNCFVLMPTGAGKSLTYQLPALLDQGLTVIISPLLSLIQDQVSSLRCIRAIADQVESLTGDLSWDASKAILDRCRNGEIKMLYVTPEKIMASRNVKSLFIALNQCNMLSRFVVDESHCVSQWGFDFRESYSQLSCLRQDYHQVPIMALTATATPLVARHIIETLQIQGCEQFQHSFNRTNLYYEVRRKGSRQSTIADMVKFITERFRDQSGIVYCLSKYDCESVSQSLSQHGIRSDYYHASRDINERQRIHDLWTRNQIQVVCATVAFGMGINKRDVRFVIHFSMSKSPEAFYQESGRAGRDGLMSHCLLYYSVTDRRRAIHLVSSANEDQTERNPEQVARDLKLLDRMTLYCEHKCQCRRSMMLEYFGEMFNRNDCKQSCDNCSGKQNKNRVRKDVTKYLKAIICTILMLETESAYQHIPRSISTVELIIRGSKSKVICSSGLNINCPAYGIGQEFSQDDVTFMIAYLLAKGIITESVEQLPAGGLKGTLHVLDRSLSELSQPHMLEFWETIPTGRKTSGKRKSLD